MNPNKLRLQVSFPGTMDAAMTLAHNIVEAAGLENALVRYGQVVKGNLSNVWGFYIEGRPSGDCARTAVNQLMKGALCSAEFQLRDGSPIMPSAQPKDVWHVSL